MQNKTLSIHLLKEGEVDSLQKVAQKVWPATFKEILSPAQIAYMMEMMYSPKSLLEQQKSGCRLFILKKDAEDIGFISLEHNKDDSGKTKVHKIYVLQEIQGTGAGKFLMDHAFAEAEKYGDAAVFLNVNRYNKAIGFYEYYGFKKMYTEDIDIGQGYLMEDWVMERPLNSP